MRVLLDTNVILDVLLFRQPFVTQSRQIWQAVDNGEIQGFAVASTITDIFYIARKQAGLTEAFKAVNICLRAFELCSVDRQLLEKALTLPGSDFEDSVQEACASTYSLDYIVTRDKTGFQTSSVVALTPAELIAQFGISNT